MPRSRVDGILRSGLQEKEIGSGSKRPLCDVGVGVADERPSKSVAFQFDDAGGRLSSGRCELVVLSDAGQSFPSSSRSDDTDYGMSESESIARKLVDDVSGKRVCEAAGLDLPGSSDTALQHRLGTGRSKYYPSASARTLLKECFADNPPVQLHPHQQLTGMSSDQMIQFAKAIGLEVSLATFGMLEELLLRANLIGRCRGGRMASSRSVFSSRAGTSVGESIASQSVYSLPTITESTKNEQVAMSSQKPCSSRQAMRHCLMCRLCMTKVGLTV